MAEDRGMAVFIADLDQTVPLRVVLGYLNFSHGKPDAGFQRQLSDAFAFFTAHGSASPRADFHDALMRKLEALEREGPGGVKEVGAPGPVAALEFVSEAEARRRDR